MSKNNDDNLILIILLAVGGLIAYVVWQFATTFGLDMATAGTVLFRLLVLGVVTVLLWKFAEYSPFELANTWPWLVGFLWVCWWPALDYWASQQALSFLADQVTLPWWDAWYSKAGGFGGLVGLCYYIRSWFK